MKNLLALLAAALVTFGVVGWYLDWYRISSTPTENGRRTVTIDLNSAKIGEDIEKGKEKLSKILDKGKDENTTNTETTQNPKSTPAQNSGANNQQSNQFQVNTEGGFGVRSNNDGFIFTLPGQNSQPQSPAVQPPTGQTQQPNNAGFNINVDRNGAELPGGIRIPFRNPDR